jgi:hypothetical protein
MLTKPCPQPPTSVQSPRGANWAGICEPLLLTDAPCTANRISRLVFCLMTSNRSM